MQEKQQYLAFAKHIIKHTHTVSAKYIILAHFLQGILWNVIYIW